MREFYEDHMKVVDETLAELGCTDKTQIKLFNKIDVLEDKDKISYVKNKYSNSILISAQRGINITEVKEKLIELYENNYKEKRIILDVTQSKLIAQVHEIADVLSANYVDDKVEITFKTDSVNHSRIEKLVENNFG